MRPSTFFWILGLLLIGILSFIGGIFFTVNMGERILGSIPDGIISHMELNVNETVLMREFNRTVVPTIEASAMKAAMVANQSKVN